MPDVERLETILNIFNELNCCCRKGEPIYETSFVSRFGDYDLMEWAAFHKEVFLSSLFLIVSKFYFIPKTTFFCNFQSGSANETNMMEVFYAFLRERTSVHLFQILDADVVSVAILNNAV